MRPNVMLPLVHATAHNSSHHHHHHTATSHRRNSSGGDEQQGGIQPSPPNVPASGPAPPRGGTHHPPAASQSTTPPHPPLASVNPSQSPLFCLVGNRSWEELVRRCRRAKPNELFVRDVTTGNTLLHEACRVDPPPNVIEALAALSRTPNFQGATPLHMAASHRCSANALRALLDAATSIHAAVPENTTTGTPAPTTNHHPTADLSSMGRAPIHYACMSFRGLDMDAFMLLLDETLTHGNRQFVIATSSQSKYDDLETRDDLDDDGSYLFDFDNNNDDYNNPGDSNANVNSINNTGIEAGTVDEKQYYDPIFEDTDLLLQRSSSHHRRRDARGTDGDDDDDNAITVNVMSLKDAVGMTPLALLFRRYRQRVRTVISRIDQLHVHNPNLPSRAALVSAMTVHVELGELWEKARRIIAKLTQARLVTEQQQQQQRHERQQRLKSQYEGTAESHPSNDPVHEHQFQAAARWAAEKHKRPTGMAASPDDVLPIPDPASVESDGDSVDRDEAPPSNPAGRLSSSDDDEDVAVAGTGTSTDDVTKAPPRRQFRIVHASVGLVGYGCPPEMIRLAISLHPHQVHEMDEDGNLPLHIAVQSSSYLTSAAAGFSGGDGANDWNMDPNNAADDRSVRSAWSFFSTATISQTPHPFDKVIKILLQHYPEGAMTPQGRTGQLPLTLAIRHGNRTWQDGIRTLLNAYPPALHSQRLFDPVLYPHVLATLGSAAQPGGVPSSLLPLSTIGVIGNGTAGGLGTSGKRSESDESATPTSPTLMPPPSSTSSSPPPSSKQLRREACARYTFYLVLRTKPEWLTPDGRD